MHTTTRLSRMISAFHSLSISSLPAIYACNKLPQTLRCKPFCYAYGSCGSGIWREHSGAGWYLLYDYLWPQQGRREGWVDLTAGGWNHLKTCLLTSLAHGLKWLKCWVQLELSAREPTHSPCRDFFRKQQTEGWISQVVSRKFKRKHGGTYMAFYDLVLSVLLYFVG